MSSIITAIGVLSVVVGVSLLGIAYVERIADALEKLSNAQQESEER